MSHVPAFHCWTECSTELILWHTMEVGEQHHECQRTSLPTLQRRYTNISIGLTNDSFLFNSLLSYDSFVSDHMTTGNWIKNWNKKLPPWLFPDQPVMLQYYYYYYYCYCCCCYLLLLRDIRLVLESGSCCKLYVTSFSAWSTLINGW